MQPARLRLRWEDMGERNQAPVSTTLTRVQDETTPRPQALVRRRAVRNAVAECCRAPTCPTALGAGFELRARSDAEAEVAGAGRRRGRGARRRAPRPPQ